MKKVNDTIKPTPNCGMEGFTFLGFPSPRSPFSINLPLPLNFGIDCPARATNAAPMIARTFVIAVAGIRREMIEEASVPKTFA